MLGGFHEVYASVLAKAYRVMTEISCALGISQAEFACSVSHDSCLGFNGGWLSCLPARDADWRDDWECLSTVVLMSEFKHE